MIRYIILIVFILLASTNFSLAFRCGLDLATTGYTKKQVREACAKPSFTEIVCADDEIITIPQKKNKSNKCKKKVEQWHYDCGEGDFIYILTFEKGVLIKETAAGRGHVSSECGIQ
jgi:hypothetical protein